MHIFEESLNRFIKNSWIYYEANDPYYAGKIEQISIERVHDKILYYEVKATIQTRWSEEILNFRVNEYGTLFDYKLYLLPRSTFRVCAFSKCSTSYQCDKSKNFSVSC